MGHQVYVVLPENTQKFFSTHSKHKTHEYNTHSIEIVDFFPDNK